MSTREFSSPQAVAADMAREFREDASRWTQGCYARTAEGLDVRGEDAEAVCWCLRGAIDKRTDWARRLNQDTCRAFETALGLSPRDNEWVFTEWNDTPGRTVAEVIALCDKVAQS